MPSKDYLNSIDDSFFNKNPQAKKDKKSYLSSIDNNFFSEASNQTPRPREVIINLDDNTPPQPVRKNPKASNNQTGLDMNNTRNVEAYQGAMKDLEQQKKYANRKPTWWDTITGGIFGKGAENTGQMFLNTARFADKLDPVTNFIDQKVPLFHKIHKKAQDIVTGALQQSEHRGQQYDEINNRGNGPQQIVYSAGQQIMPIVATEGLGEIFAGARAVPQVAKTLSNVMFSVGSGANAARQAELEGATPGQQLGYGLTTGGLMYASNPMFSKLGEVFGKGAMSNPLVQKYLGKFLADNGESGFKWLVNKGVQTLGQTAYGGVQGMAFAPAQNTAAKLTYKKDMPWTGEGGVLDWNQMKESGRDMAATMLLLNLLGAPVEYAGRKAFNGSPEEIQVHHEDGTVETIKPEDIGMKSDMSAPEFVGNDRVQNVVNAGVQSQDRNRREFQPGEDVVWKSEFANREFEGRYLGRDESGNHIVEFQNGEEPVRMAVDPESIRPVDTQSETSRSPVYDDIYAKVKENRPSNVSEADWEQHAQHVAQMWEARANTEAQRRGISVDDWYKGINRPEVNQSGETIPGAQTLDQPVYHGTTADIDRFDLSKIGSGVGQDLFGWGINFSSKREMAEHYQSMLGERSGRQGELYRAEIPEDIELLDWEKPLREQSPKVKEGLLRIIRNYPELKDSIGATGGEFYKALSDRLGGDQEASRVFNEAGIPGSKHFTKLMGGTNNYVIWDEASMPITEKSPRVLNQEGARGRASITNESSVISLMDKADASTFMHESAHVWLKDMHDYVMSGEANEAYKQHWQTVKDWLGIKDGQSELTTEQQEKFARGVEQYIMEGKAPTSKLAQAFEAFKQWLVQIYKTADSLKANVNDDVRGFMDRMFATDEEIPRKEPVQPREPGGSYPRGTYADMGGYSDSVPSNEAVPPIPREPVERPQEIPNASPSEQSGNRMEMPEIIEIVKMINDGKVPLVKAKLGRALGLFSTGDGNIKLNADIFKDPKLAARVIAHEIGHLVDWMPDKDMSRGNILGRLASVKRYMKTLIDEIPKEPSDVITPKDRVKLRREAEIIAEESGGDASSIYQQMINKEINNRRLITKDQVINELKSLSMEWKPFDPNADPKFTQYRFSSPELYADAVSVLFNDPDRLQQKAPTFYKAMMDYMERKPEFNAAYNEIQNRISSPEAVNEKRLNDLYAMQKKGNEVRNELNKRNQTPLESIKDTLTRWFVDKNHGILKRVREGMKSDNPAMVELAKKARFELEETNYIASEAESYLHDVSSKILAPLEENGLKAEDVGAYMFLDRVINERSEMANPYGHTRETAQATMGQLRKRLGEAKFGMLQRFVNAYRTIREESIVPRLEDSKMYSPELVQQIKEAKSYAKFSVQRYLEDKFGTGTTSKIYKQIGTLADIENPFVATVVQDISALRAAKINEAKTATLDLLKNIDSESMDIAKRGTGGEYMEPKDPRKENLYVLENGELKAYVVDKEIAKSFETKPFESTMIAKIWSGMMQPIREVMVSKNPLWMARNVIRDFLTTAKNIPEVRIRDLFKLGKYYNQAFREAWSDVMGGNRSKDISSMMKNRMLSPDRIYSGREANYENDLERLVTEFQVSPYEASQSNKAIGALKKVWETLGKFGRVSEVTGKVAGYKYLVNETGRTPEEIGHIVRTRIGTPDARRSGELQQFTNNVFMFSNIGKEGMRSAFESFNENRGAYVWKTMMFNVMPKLVLRGAALVGTSYLKDILDGIPQYDKMMYTIVPIGKSKDGKSIYLRLPQDYEGQTFGALFWALTEGKIIGKRGVVDTIGQANPYQLNPIIDVATKLYQYYAQGINPQDDFRGKSIIPDTQFKAGGLEASKSMGKYAWSSLGGSSLYDPNKSDFNKPGTNMEKLLRLPIFNVLGTFLRYSDQGYSEKMYEDQDKEDKEKAQKTLARQNAVRDSLKKGEPTYDRMKLLRLMLISKKVIDSKTSIAEFKRSYLSDLSHVVDDPDLALILRQGSAKERSEALYELKKRVPVSRYIKLLAKLQKLKVSTKAAR